jgi:hypothetical protein
MKQLLPLTAFPKNQTTLLSNPPDFDNLFAAMIRPFKKSKGGIDEKA